MKARYWMTAALAVALPLEMAAGQNMIMVPTGNDATPVSQHPPIDPEDTPEEIAKDAARDLKDTRFYNRPGATRADYDRDWQECRLIARGSRTPTGSIPYYYNPSVISPMAAGIGAGIGGLLGAAIVEGQQRRMNRRQCLLIKGWRLVEVPAADATTVTAMTDDQRSAYFDTIVGATEVKGEVTERTRFALDTAALGFDLRTGITVPGGLFAGKNTDPDLAITPAEGEAILVLAFRRGNAGSDGRSGVVNLHRYDIEGRDRFYRPRDWKKAGDLTTYTIAAQSFDKKAAYEAQVLRVTAGAYVIDSHAAGPLIPAMSFCFGAPVVQAKAGEVVYLGDFTPMVNARTKDGQRFDGIIWSSHPDDARATLATKQPALAEKMVMADWRNRATYACAAQSMDRWDLPGMAELAPPAQKPDGQATETVVTTDEPASVQAAGNPPAT